MKREREHSRQSSVIDTLWGFARCCYTVAAAVVAAVVVIAPLLCCAGVFETQCLRNPEEPWVGIEQLVLRIAYTHTKKHARTQAPFVAVSKNTHTHTS